MRQYMIYFILLGVIHPVRCWVGVIDQINPPWVKVVGESGDTLQLHLDQAYPNIKAGDWVIYWTQQKVLEHLVSPGSQKETERQENLMKYVFQLP